MLTPVEARDGYYFKRDDLYEVAGVRGGKARTCRHLSEGATGLVTAGSRQSPQIKLVAYIARELGIPCRAHCPQGELSEPLIQAREAGAEIVQHRAGYNSVIIARAREDAAARGWTNIPFGMECEEAVTQTRRQVANMPPDIRRIVIPCGSGMSLAGLLHGLLDHDLRPEVIAVQVGADPMKRLLKYAPSWAWGGNLQIVKSPLDYHAHAPQTMFAGVDLDPVYEAKCIPFIQPGDLLWVVGNRY